MKKMIAPLLAALILSACASSSPDVVQRQDTQRLSQVQDATVLNVRPVTVDGSQSGAGAVTGGVVGAIAGSSIGGRRESAVVGVLGAVAGAMVGNAVERGATKEEAVEIILQLNNGERRAIVQAKGQEQFQPGERVILVTSSGKSRVAKTSSYNSR